MNWKPLNYTPEVCYHFTKKENVEKIKADRQLKKFKDIYVFVCESYEGCIQVINRTLLNPNARYYDFAGILRSYGDVNLDDYCIIKLKPRFNKIENWYISQASSMFIKPHDNEGIDKVSIAHKGNLPIEVLEILPIELENK